MERQLPRDPPLAPRLRIGTTTITNASHIAWVECDSHTHLESQRKPSVPTGAPTRCCSAEFFPFEHSPPPLEIIVHTPATMAAAPASIAYFKKYSLDDIASQAKVKSSVQRGMKRSIVEQYPLMEEKVESLFPRGDAEEAKGFVQRRSCDCAALLSYIHDLCAGATALPS